MRTGPEDPDSVEDVWVGAESEDGPIAVDWVRSSLGDSEVGSGGGEVGGFWELKMAVVVSERMAR